MAALKLPASYGLWPLVAVAAVMLLALAVLLGGAPPLHAAGGGIEVVRQEADVKLPRGVTFDLEVEAEEEIVEIRLSYRNAHGGPWTYTYLALDPATRVAASFTLDPSATTYIPPGAEVEFFYTILDAAGNERRTEPGSLTYSDPRFEWQSTSIGQLTLMWHDQPERRVKAVTSQLQTSLARVEELLGVTLEAPVNGVIYNTRDEADLAFPNLSPTIDDRQIFHGFAFSEWNAFTAVGLHRDIITHETTHLLLDQALSRALVPVPAWLNEGFASYMEPGSSPRSARELASGRRYELPLTSMGAVGGTPAAIGFFYRKSESVVGFMLEGYGDEAFRRFLDRLNSGRRLDAAMLDVYGFDRAGLEERWRGAPASQGSDGRNDNDSLFLQFEGMVLGGIVLLVAAVVMVRSVYRRMVRSGAAGAGGWDPDGTGVRDGWGDES